MNKRQIHRLFPIPSRNRSLGKTYTSKVIKDLASKGVKRLLILCPAFVADCLETVYEVSVEYGDEFKALGGEHVQLVESLNDHPKWIAALYNTPQKLDSKIRCKMN